MSTLYPMDFHRRVDRRWAERMTLAAADAHGSWPMPDRQDSYGTRSGMRRRG